MRFSPLVDRIAGEETGAWRVHHEGMRRREAGHDVIFLTIGDPDQAAPAAVIDATIEALRQQPHRLFADHRLSAGARRGRRADAEPHRPAVQCRQCRPDARNPGWPLLRAATASPGPGDEVILPGADLRPLCRGDRRERGPHGECAVARRERFSSRPRQPRPRGDAANAGHLDQHPAQPDRRRIYRRRGRRHRRAVPRARFVARLRRGLRRPRLHTAACQPVVTAGHGGAHDRRLQPLEIACDGGLPLRLG